MQDAYIAEQAMVIIDGYIGNDPEHRSRARLYIEEANANIAGMQQQLYFGPDPGDTPGEAWQPELVMIYTPNLPMPDYPEERLIAVDLESGISRIFNSDYFGESKKGGLRMWNERIQGKGGLAMHAGCKVIPTDGGEKTVLIIGLSGTGKTTTTFTRQNGSQPVQDDFIALFPGGRVIGTENGCFAKTFGLDPAHEPAIHGAVVKPDAYLENVSQADAGGPVDFFDTSYTKNGRATFPMSSLGIWRDPREIGPVTHLLILNRNDNIVPGVARLYAGAGGRLLHARRDAGHVGRRGGGGGQGAARARYEPVLPLARRGAGKPLPRPHGQRRLRGLPPEHRPRRRR